jgi:ribosomal protein S18 acetylase RimI-like enzyme
LNPAAATIRLDDADASQDAATALLARAHFDSPHWTWMIPDAGRRAELLPLSMRASVRWGLLMGETYTTPTLDGIAIWAPPGMDGADLDPHGSWRDFIAAADDEVTTKIDAMGDEQISARRRAADGRRYWYLGLLGVDPHVQRTGIGSTLLAAMFERTDAAGEPCIVDTEREANVPYYERHGFRVTNTARLPLDGPPCWTMLRDPQ